MPSRLPLLKLNKLIRRLEDTDKGLVSIVDTLKINRKTIYRIRTLLDLFS